MENQKLGKGGFGRPDTRPCFYKIIWIANTNYLRIPRDFKHHLPEESEMAALKTQTGNWVVKVLRREGDVYLGQGWQEFVKHHSLGRGEFLVFKYNGDMSFEVVIFETNGSIRNTPPPPPPPPVHTPCKESILGFTSSLPFFTHVIKKYNVGTSSHLIVPQKFQGKYIPLSIQRIVIRDPNGISWPINTSLINTKFLGMFGGWKAFADHNSIQLGDVCIFELVEQDSMQVNIFRHN